MTELPNGPAVFGLTLGPDLCRPLSRALGRVIDLAFAGPGKARVTGDDVILLDFQAQVLAVVRGSARFREALAVPPCGQEPALTVTEAAELAGISEEMTRRHCRRGRAFRAWRGGPGGAWLIDAGEFTAWTDSRRKEDDGRAA